MFLNGRKFKERGGGEDLFVDLLEEGDLLLQRLNASFQVQTSQSGSVHVLQQIGHFKKRKPNSLSEFYKPVILIISRQNTAPKLGKYRGRALSNPRTHRPESCKVVFCIFFLKDFFLESGGDERQSHIRQADSPPGFASGNNTITFYVHFKKKRLT